MKKYLQGHICQQNAYKVDDYPYGFRERTTIFYWIETKDGIGDRFCSCTINPKTGKLNKPKCSTYSTFMYMYINEDSHVTYGIIDAYDREKFEARFEFIFTKLDPLYITELQQKNIRVNAYQHIKANAPYQYVKYCEANKPIFAKWVQDTLKHIRTCEFKELVNYSPKPAYDMPNESVKMITTETYIL